MDKKKLLNRLRRIEGQVRGLQKMIDEERECNDILTQMSAITGALHKTGEEIVRSYTKTCIMEYDKSGDETLLEDLIANLSKFKNL
jgi:DNA-binding FrmR family transcriptional regulator